MLTHLFFLFMQNYDGKKIIFTLSLAQSRFRMVGHIVMGAYIPIITVFFVFCFCLFVFKLLEIEKFYQNVTV